jgi:hypothetical protein
MLCSAIGGAGSACESIRLRYWGGIALAVIGSLVVCISIIQAINGAHRASEAGAPWAAHRALTRLTVWLDARLPGERQPERPRLGVGVLLVVIAVLLGVGVKTGDGLWQEHRAAVNERRHQAARLELRDLRLPPGLTRRDGDGCTSSADDLCASSDRTPGEVEAAMQHLLDGRSSDLACELTSQLEAQLPSRFVGDKDCEVVVYGTIAGYPAMAIAFDHLIIVASGATPPAGAVPVSPGSKRGFYLGSDVHISLLTPEA